MVLGKCHRRRSIQLDYAVEALSIAARIIGGGCGGTRRRDIGAQTGALFTSLTMTVKLLVSLSGGVPLSVTRTVMTLVLGPCISPGVQVRTPVAEFSVIPLGPATKANV